MPYVTPSSLTLHPQLDPPRLKEELKVFQGGKES